MNKNIIKKIFDRFKKNNFSVYLVGGYVRDMLLGYESDDIDMTTDAKPDEIIAIFSDCKTILTAIKYGTVTVFIDDVYVEITTFRSDVSYTDGRHPFEISFEKDIEKDLSRRDFTINAIAYNYIDGYIDIFGGKKDIKEKMIRCVGEPTKRFDEDKLRMLRAVRFASVLDFKIEENTFCAIKNMSHKINEISKERINAELTRMLLSKNPSKAIYLLYETGLLKQIIHIKKENISKIVSILDKSSECIEIRLAILIYYSKYYDKSIKNLYVKEILQSLRYSNKTINNVCIILDNIIDINTKDCEIRKIIYTVGLDRFENIIQLHKLLSTVERTNTISDYKITLLLENPIVNIKQLAINSNDLLSLGYKGREIGYILDRSLEVVFKNPNLNEKSILINKISQF